ncbi:ATP-binding protein [Delftia tsuruhatensis]|uniref:ATP-binding protein n=1 Tax=Delftia tsuruhatensis TaxID=180282 RepID=UPI001CB9115B|nr:ATP-binding protein [Delftia tsuruhatensis]
MNSEDGFGFLPQRGEMAARVRAHDWAATPLGTPQSWPQSLRNAASLMLGSRFPIIIWWGDDFRLIYNDAYIPFLGTSKHPKALGQAGAQCWSEIWDDIGPMLEGVLRTGQATWSTDARYFFDRELPQEEVFVTFTYGPILADDGITVQGVFCPCTDTTEKIVSRRRLETLHRLGIRTLDMRSAKDAGEKVCAVLDENPYDVPFAIIYECQAAPDAGSADTAPPAFQLLCSTGMDTDLAADPAPWPLAQAVQSGQPANVDLAQLGLTLPGGPWPEPSRLARIVPVRWSGDGQASGVLVLGVSPRRPLDAEYCAFLDMVASHTGGVVAHAVAYEQEARRARALAEVDRAKTVFFSNVSHELRTPLTLILGPLDDALREHGGHLPPDQAQMVHRNALRLQKLVNALLDFARIEAGRMQASYEPTDLARATAELASVFRSAMEQAGLRLRVDCPPLQGPVYVDQDMYEKIVLNLLSNAFKFTLQGEIAVALHDAGPAVELSVSDTGSGIAPQHLPHLFQRFHRIPGKPARTHEGTGIGLALVQELVRLHGGTITVTSTEGEGSRFTVRLPKGSAHLPAEQVNPIASPSTPPLPPGHGAGAPAARQLVDETRQWVPGESPTHAPHAPHGVPAGAEPQGPRPRIVCADDNADMRGYIGQLLRPLYEVEVAGDGRAALDCIRRQRPDLVIADVMMPVLDGFELLHALRSDEATRSIPVIMLSARAGQEAQVEGLRAGADDYLVKPFSARELLARVASLLQLERVREQAHAALRANEKRLRAIIDQMPAGVGVSDMGGTMVLSNALMDRFVPRAIPSTLADRVQRWRGWDDKGRPIPPENWPGRRALRGEVVMPGLEMLHTDDEGREWWMRVSAAPLRDDGGQLVGTCSVIQDITELKRAEQHLREADRRKDEFLATLAHELRNPLAPISHGLQILKRTVHGDDSARRSQEMLERQVNHMVRMVDDLLEVSRITTGKVQLRKEVVDLNNVLQGVAAASHAVMESGGHQLRLELPAETLLLPADPVRLAQMVTNLLNNAAKYTDPGGHVVLAAWAEGAQAVISVRDDGIGIPAALLDRIFDMFMQVDRGGRRGQGGLGIGLTLVRSLVEMHGGSVQALSEGPGQGSELRLRLPLPAHAPADASAHAPADVPSLPGPAAGAQSGDAPAFGRILVVDDNADAADTLSMLLGLLGAEVEIARDGPGALAMHDAFRPDVVLLDIGLPGMDGLEVARRIRARQGRDQVLLIALTGWGQEDDLRRSREAGMDHHLVKPVSFDTLERLLRSLRTSA